MIKIDVTVNFNSEIHTLSAVKGKRLKDLLSEAGFSVPLPCGGSGRCGKCVVLFSKGAPRANDSDRAFLSEKEIAEGKRLLCRCILEGDCEIVLNESFHEENIVVRTSDAGERPGADAEGRDFGIAIDIGTTTIAAALIADIDGKTTVFDTLGRINHQRRFGADVISRISAGEDESVRTQMQQSVREDIAEIIGQLLERNPGIHVSALCFTGNTTMLHLLRGYDTEGLGKYPYTPVSTGMEEMSLSEVLSEYLTAPTLTGEEDAIIMPGISAFVGADIVSGIYSTGLCREQGRRRLLMDLGTNGEMAYFDGEQLFCTSTAAGPCFEGGGINCGVPSIPGAICGVEISGNDSSEIKLTTIAGKKPIGICGSGILELVSELVRCGIVDKTGLLSDEFFEGGYEVFSQENIVLTQKDIRNIQLAKAAIYAGADRLTGGGSPEEIYISGGFGSSTNPDRIRNIKLFPPKWSGKMIPSGNTALDGAVKFLGQILLGKENGARAREEINSISERAKELVLNSREGFDEAFVEAMNF